MALSPGRSCRYISAVMSESAQIRKPDPAAYAAAAALLRAGRLVAFPTETVYGLGADATNDRAVAAIFEAKGRPRFNPLIVHFHDPAAAEAETRFGRMAERLAAAFWPGPLTLVLPRRKASAISLLCSAGLDSLAVRVPSHPVGRRLLESCGLPLAAPSANASGKVSPTTAAHVADSLGARVPLILDGGPCPLGVESTVVDLTGTTPVLLRPGGVPSEDLEEVIGPLERPDATGPLRSPGLLESHYAPGRPLRIEVSRVDANEALLAFGPNPLEGAAATVNLSASGDLGEAAARLFAALRELDRPAFQAIAVMPIPEGGLGAAINDRLRRAAAPRG
jgi:L-threonylcarbamoyladenylate synthase